MMRNLILSSAVLLAMWGAYTPVHAQIEIQPKLIVIDSGPQSQNSAAFHSIDMDSRVWNVRSSIEKGHSDGGCQVGQMASAQAFCAIKIKTFSPPASTEFIDIQYDQGEAVGAEEGENNLFIGLPSATRMSTQFVPKTSSDDSRKVYLDRIWIAPYFDNQFLNTELPSSAPRDITIYIYSNEAGSPGEVLFEKVIEDTRDFVPANYDLNFLEINLSDEEIGALPDVVHIAYGNAGNDENLLIIGPAPYTTQDVSDLTTNGIRWRELWEATDETRGKLFHETMVPIRARFRLGGTDNSFQFAQQVANQSFPIGQAITPFVLPEASGAGTAPFSYSLKPELPSGLSFNPSTRTVSGTPLQVTATPVTYTYTATDANGFSTNLRFTIEIYSADNAPTFVDIQYDPGELLSTPTDGGRTISFGLLPPAGRMATQFIPKASSRDNQEIRIDRVWLSPYYLNQLRESSLSDSAPRDLTLYIYSDQAGMPGEVLFSKMIEDPRAYSSLQSLDLDFFEIDLSNEAIGILPDTVHIAYGNAGTDENLLLTSGSYYPAENLSYLSANGTEWSELWNYLFSGEAIFDKAVIPIRARFQFRKGTPVQIRQARSLPETFVVHGNYPNPFQKSTNLHFDLPAPARVSIEVIDMLGRRVLAVPPVELTAGSGQHIALDGQSLAPGHYLYRVMMSSVEGSSVQTGQFVRFR